MLPCERGPPLGNPFFQAHWTVRMHTFPLHPVWPASSALTELLYSRLSEAVSWQWPCRRPKASVIAVTRRGSRLVERMVRQQTYHFGLVDRTYLIWQLRFVRYAGYGELSSARSDRTRRQLAGQSAGSLSNSQRQRLPLHWDFAGE